MDKKLFTTQNGKRKSIWDILIPLDTTDPEMRVPPSVGRKKIVFTPDPEIKPLANPNPIQTNITNANNVKQENIKPATVSVPVNNSNSVAENQANANAPENTKPASAFTSEKSGHRPFSSTSQPNEGGYAGKTNHEEHKTTGKTTNTGDADDSESKNSSGKKSNSWQVVAAVILLIIIITATYFINEKIKENRKKRTEKDDDDFFDSFFDTKTGDVVRFGGTALGLLIAVLALLYSTKLLTQAIKAVHESTND